MLGNRERLRTDGVYAGGSHVLRKYFERQRSKMESLMGRNSGPTALAPGAWMPGQQLPEFHPIPVPRDKTIQGMSEIMLGK